MNQQYLLGGASAQGRVQELCCVAEDRGAVAWAQLPLGYLCNMLLTCDTKGGGVNVPAGCQRAATELRAVLGAFGGVTILLH